ncbi:diguanylate cyclase domain-containing protein [Neobacillus drentensis]|uniref:diguanylate cyclase domain-containing protein n=1 Tax=Neobacillus drentensis TaxID=220684 RepID=UPI0028609398|nr:diguanylate cyclase [Neobacillus drentensis]MDR7239591.1 diguanylate cyclase (GGDEF)-like protein [Neobacillus drentensis]
MRSFPNNLFNRIDMNSIPHQEFIQNNYEVLFERIKLVSYMLIFTYPCFFIVDFFLFNKLSSPTFKFNLSAIHIAGLIISLIFLFIYQFYKNLPKRVVVTCYILCYLLIGAASSINGQLFTGNIYSYIIILLGVGVFFPVQPRNLLILFLGIHIFFITGLYLIEHEHFSFLSKAINSTGTLVISFLIALSFYSFRKNDFSNKMKLKRNEENFRRLFNLHPNPIILIRMDNDEILLMNRHASEYYHLQCTDSTPLDGKFLFKTEEEKHNIVDRLKEEKSIKNYCVQQQITPDLRKWVMLSLELVDYLDEACILIGVTDITDLKKNEEELYKHASFDMLTGVLNRRSGLELLSQQLSAGSESQEFIICYIDINDLKKTNDLFGHSTGDDLIKTCCDTINHHITNKDVLFRLGGDEFIIVFFQKQMKDVQQHVKNIKRVFEEINGTNQKPYSISASYGFYHYKPGTVITLERILEMADQEMYKEKCVHKRAKVRTKPTPNSNRTVS